MVDLEKLLTGDAMKNPVLHNGDTVYISKTKYDWKRIFFFAGGLNTIKELLGFNW
jgi:hypothetical protein